MFDAPLIVQRPKFEADDAGLQRTLLPLRGADRQSDANHCQRDNM